MRHWARRYNLSQREGAFGQGTGLERPRAAAQRQLESGDAESKNKSDVSDLALSSEKERRAAAAMTNSGNFGPSPTLLRSTAL